MGKFRSTIGHLALIVNLERMAVGNTEYSINNIKKESCLSYQLGSYPVVCIFLFELVYEATIRTYKVQMELYTYFHKQFP